MSFSKSNVFSYMSITFSIELTKVSSILVSYSNLSTSTYSRPFLLCLKQDLENLDTSMWLRFGELLEEITIDEELIENDKDEEDWNSLLINVEEIETLNDIVQNFTSF